MGERKGGASVRDKQVRIPSKLLPFEQKSPAALATVQTRLPALACSYLNTYEVKLRLLFQHIKLRTALFSTHKTTALETGKSTGIKRENGRRQG